MKHISDIYIIVLICCLLQGECKIYRLWEHMSKGENCEGGEGIAHLIRVGVGTFQVNKKQIVTAEQSHLWRFNTLIHTNAHTHDTHTRANCLYAMWNFSLRACNPFQATRFAPLYSPFPGTYVRFAYFGYFYCMRHTGRIQISQDSISTSTSSSPHLSDVFRFRI